MTAKTKLIYGLAALVILLQVVDGVTTFVVLGGDPERRDSNPVAATVFENAGLSKGLTAIKAISAAAVLWVLLRTRRGTVRSERKALICLSVCALLMLYVAANNIIQTWYHIAPST